MTARDWKKHLPIHTDPKEFVEYHMYWTAKYFFIEGKKDFVKVIQDGHKKWAMR